MKTTVVSTKGLLLIPKRLRVKYGFESGSRVVFEETEEALTIKPMNQAYFENIQKSLKDSMPTISEFREMKKKKRVRKKEN